MFQLFISSPESDQEDKDGPLIEAGADKPEEKHGQSSTSEDVKKPEKQPPNAESSVNNKKKRNRNRKKKGGATATPEASKAAAPGKPATVTAKSSKAPNVPAVKNGGVVKAKKAFNKSSQSKKFHKNIKELDKKDATHISENRLRALGINPKKYQSKLIYGNKE